MHDHLATHAEVLFVRNIGNWTLNRHRTTTSKLALLALYVQGMKGRHQWAGINPHIVMVAVREREQQLRAQL